MTTRQRRFKLLLDEMFPRRDKYPQLNNYHNIRHITHDLKEKGSSDEEVVKLAKKLGRIVITKNIKHLRELGEKHSVDILGISETIPPEKMDKQIMAILRKRKYIKLKGRFTKITSQ